MGWTSENTFRFWVPAQAVVCKGGRKGADKKGRRWIEGIASTSSRDLQGEIVEQNGIDFRYFLKYGYFNYDHKKDIEYKIGQPTECKVTPRGLWVKGYLLEGKDQADKVWEHMQSLDRSGASRRMGFSIEGKVKRRAGAKILECWIKDIAITPAPVNVTTWAQIAKSLTEQWVSDEEDSPQQKAVTAVGNVQVPESLDREEKKQEVQKGLDFSSTVSFLEKNRGLSPDAARNAAYFIFRIST